MVGFFDLNIRMHANQELYAYNAVGAEEGLTVDHRYGRCEGVEPELVWQHQYSDEYLWEYQNPRDLVYNIIPKNIVKNFVDRGGGLRFTDEPNPVVRFHNMKLWAYHSCKDEILLLKLALI